MTDILLTPIGESRRNSVAVSVDFVETKGEVRFDVRGPNSSEFMNITIENARELTAALREVNKEAALYEKRNHVKVKEPLVPVERDGITYMVPPGVVDHRNFNTMTPFQLMQNALIVIKDGNVVKNLA